VVSGDVPTPVVPPAVAVVRDFVNTTDHEFGTDDIDSAAKLTRYLRDSGLLTTNARASSADLALAHELRAGLRRALELNHDGLESSVPELDAALASLPLELHWLGSSAQLRPTRSGVAAALSEVAIAMQQTMAADQWWRLKICLSDECEWAFYDRSKNRSARWCEYGCGDRIKMRAYRARQKSTAH
jgi:predicted RNA-binding Zn ribbon-like protein